MINQKVWLPYLWNQFKQQTTAIFQFRSRWCIRFAVAFRSEEEVFWRRGPSLTYWIHLWADLAKIPKRMCRAMIISSLPSLVNIHQSVCRKGYVFPYIYKHFTTYKSIEIGLKYTKMTKFKKTSKTRQIFDFNMEPKITMLLPICFYINAMHWVCCCSPPIWRRSPLWNGPLIYLFCPALDPPLGGVYWKA